MFFKVREKKPDIREGAEFQRLSSMNVAEKAKVLWVGKDSFGIPHVRYEMAYIHPGRAEPQGTRVLALESFSSRFCSAE